MIKKELCVLSIGSNMGDREDNLRRAVLRLSENGAISDIRVSSIYETEPVGYENQSYFYNICVSFLTDLEPLSVLDYIQGIEQELLRVRTIKNGPRTIDLDILLYGEQTINEERLIVPHPRMYERAFVLVPLTEIGLYDGDIPDGKSVKKVKEFAF